MTDAAGLTPLHLASSQGRDKLVRIMGQSGMVNDDQYYIIIDHPLIYNTVNM